MTGDSGYGPFLTRRGRGNVLTHFIMAVLGAGLTVVLLLAFYSPASSGSGGSFPGSDAVPAPAPSAAPLASSERGIVTRVTPGVVIINTTLQYDSEAAAGTGMVINSGGLVLTNNHVIEDSTSMGPSAAAPRPGRP
jgi:S1-C subfamily serine protease